MITRRPKLEPAAPAHDRAAIIAALTAKARDLEERDRALLAEQLELEAAGAEPVDSGPEPDHQRIARQLLNGHGYLLDRATGAGERLRQVMTERRAISLALSTLGDEERRERAANVALVMQARGDDWRSIARRRAEAVMALRAANRDAAAFKVAVVREGKGAMPGLILDFTGGAFSNVIGDPLYVFLQQCAKYGIITEKEFKDARK